MSVVEYQVNISDAILELADSGIECELILRYLKEGIVRAYCDEIHIYKLLSVDFSTVDMYGEVSPIYYGVDGGLITCASSDEIMRMNNGLHFISRHPYVWIDKRTQECCSIIIASNSPYAKCASQTVGVSFWRSGVILPNYSVFVDNLNALERRYAVGVKISLSDLQLIKIKALGLPIQNVKRGRKRIYNNEKHNAEFVTWIKTNPCVSRRVQIAKLREFYQAHGLPVGDDEGGKAEARAIRLLISQIPKLPK